MGAIFGLVFSALTRGNREGGEVSVRETVIIIRERIIVREGAQSNRTQSNYEPMGVLIVLFAAMLTSIYVYAVYAEDVLYYASIVTFNVLNTANQSRWRL